MASILRATRSPRTLPLLTPFAIVAVLIAISSPVFTQGVQKDNGHCAVNGHVVVACWNPQAGRDMPKNYAQYPEFLPSLEGWDFRINLPHTRFQLARSGAGSGPAMIGVIEDAANLYEDPNATVPIVKDYGHRNNSIWMFRVSATDGQIYAKVLPSRRDVNGSATENVRRLTTGWIRVGPPGGRRYKDEAPAVVAIGKGLGMATIYIVARAESDSSLYMTKHVVATTSFVSWPEAWTPVGVTSVVRPAIAEAFNGKLALATWTSTPSARIDVRLFNPANGTWHGRVPAGAASQRRPQLIWDGTALNVFFVANNRVRHTFTTSGSPMQFAPPVDVSNQLPVVADDYHALAFNQRLHVVVRRASGAPPPHEVWYTATTTPFGQPSQWMDPSYVGFTTSRTPKIASLYEHLFVTGVGPNGRVVYSRRDPNRPGTFWLDAGTAIDPAIVGAFTDFDVLSFNSDLYLAGSKVVGVGSPAGAYVINFSRAAMRQLVTGKWGMRLLWGGPGGAAVKGVGAFAPPDEIPGIGDFNGDGLDDLVKFTQKAEPGVGPATVYVSLNDNGTLGDNTLWHKFFSLKDEIPMVGDFNGDGKDDIITFTQQEQKDAAGNIIGPAVVWVSLSTGRNFATSSVWHKFFSLKGEVPGVGDFNGDGKDDIITFTQQLQKDANGNVIGPAVVWVALSDGTKFMTSSVWHKFFSLKGEIPMVGDFNGDGKDDIVTFTQQQQKDAAGHIIGNAVVWVSLSTGTRFGPSSIWHTFFSLKGEIPQVGDVNMDGRDDIVTFLRGQGTPPERARNVFAALSMGNRFARSITWHSDFAATEQARLENAIVRSPLIGNFFGTTLGDITDVVADHQRRLPDIFAFRNDAAVHVSAAMGNIPYSPAAPWEYYKWFTEKGIGVGLFPEWIWQRPNHCLGLNHRFAVQGLAGSGGGDLTISSVRLGGRSGHILEELGHSVFANCFRQNNDVFNLFSSIFETSTANGGIDANNMPDCPKSFYDCRDPEHYFLALLSKYRIQGDAFREEIRDETDPDRKARLNAQYDWFNAHWFPGIEFKRGPSINASLMADGVPCLPGECAR